MERTTKRPEKTRPTPKQPEQEQENTVTFSSETRFIFTRCTRKVVLDDMDEFPPQEQIDLNVFN